MIILAIKTDKPVAEVYIYKNHEKLAAKSWQAQGTLADTINAKIEKMLDSLSISLKDIEGIICFAGPGSFTGLRTGMAVANALAYAQNIPVVATKGENWIDQGIRNLQAGKNQKIVTPNYDRPAATTIAKK